MALLPIDHYVEVAVITRVLLICYSRFLVIRPVSGVASLDTHGFGHGLCRYAESGRTDGRTDGRAGG